MIILSAHKDVVKYPFKMEYANGTHKGLLDNHIGILAVYVALYSNQSLMEVEKQGDLKILHTDHEEFALPIDATDVTDDDIVIVVDVCAGEQYQGMDFALENVSEGYAKKFDDTVVKHLKWEGFKFFTKLYDGSEENADEAYQWIDKKKNVVSFIIPIDAPNDNWHGEDATITSERLATAIRGLTRLICYL